VCEHIHAIVQQLETIALDPEPFDEEHVMNFTVDESNNDSDHGTVDYFDQETVLVPSANSIPIAVEKVDVEFNTVCEILEDNEEDLKEIEELMNTVKGSLVGGPHRDLIAIAKEALKTTVAQMATQKDRNLLSPESGSTS